MTEAQLRSRRQGYLDTWAQLSANVPDGAERFGALVQHILDTIYLASAWDAPDEVQLRRAFLDDLVDLFVPARFALLKRLVMTSPPVLSDIIVDKAADRAGFHPVLRAGGGRFRHVAMNAAAAERYPRWLVDAAARAVGYDVPWRRDPSGDTAADLAANRIGRDFSRYLKANTLAELAASGAVAAWVTGRFRSGADT